MTGDTPQANPTAKTLSGTVHDRGGVADAATIHDKAHDYRVEE